MVGLDFFFCTDSSFMTELARIKAKKHTGQISLEFKPKEASHSKVYIHFKNGQPHSPDLHTPAVGMDNTYIWCSDGNVVAYHRNGTAYTLNPRSKRFTPVTDREDFDTAIIVSSLFFNDIERLPIQQCQTLAANEPQMA